MKRDEDSRTTTGEISIWAATGRSLIEYAINCEIKTAFQRCKVGLIIARLRWRFKAEKKKRNRS